MKSSNMRSQPWLSLGLTVATTSAVCGYYLYQQRKGYNKNKGDDDESSEITKRTSGSSASNSTIRPAIEDPPLCVQTEDTKSGDDNAVLITTSQGQKIEGTILASTATSTDTSVSIMETVEETLASNPNATAVTVPSACLVGDEPTMITFVIQEEAEEETEESRAIETTNAKPPRKEKSNRDLKPPRSATSMTAPTTTLQRRKHMRDWQGSEAVIMISAEDMTMVADLMMQLQTEDDREFFDCGDTHASSRDEDEYHDSAKQKRKQWKRKKQQVR